MIMTGTSNNFREAEKGFFLEATPVSALNACGYKGTTRELFNIFATNGGPRVSL